MTSNTPGIKLHTFPSPSPMMKIGKDNALIDTKKPDKPDGPKEKIDKKIENIRYQPMMLDCLLAKYES